MTVRLVKYQGDICSTVGPNRSAASDGGYLAPWIPQEYTELSSVKLGPDPEKDPGTNRPE